MSRRKPQDNDRPGRKLWDTGAWKAAKFFIDYLSPHRWVFIPAMIALVITGALSVVFFKLLGKLAEHLLTNGPNLMQQATETVWLCMAVVSVQAVVAFFRIWLFAQASERALSSLRVDTFRKILRLPMAELQAHRIGELASRLSSDVETMRDTLVVTIPQLIRHSVMLSLALIIVVSVSLKLALFMLACIPVVIVLVALFGSRIRKLSRTAQDELAQTQVLVNESLTAITSVKAFANEDYEQSRYEQSIGRYLRAAVRAAMPRAIFVAFIIFAFSVALTAVAWFAARMLTQGQLNSDQLIQFGMFSAVVGASFAQFPELIAQFQRALGATDRVRELLQSDSEPIAPDTVSLPRPRGEIAFESVNFTYPSRPDAPVLRDLSFAVQSGQRIAIVGPSGAGKSTIVSLLFRFFEPSSGRFLLDGQDASQLPLHALRRHLALVPQEVLLFGGSIRSNIAYGRPDASEAEIQHAAREANAAQFIDQLPEGYDTLVGERGTQLSGGQRQRLAIARAILANPAILVLDEATSSLDAESERLVQDALERLMQGRTSIIIAHRLSTVRSADQILVLSQGAIVERGTHDELVAQPGSVYATLARLQLG
jgi:ATP-binding cassette, subfamily B, bacterial